MIIKKSTKAKTNQAKRFALVLTAIAVILITYTLAYKLTQNKFFPKNPFPEQITGTRVILPTHSSETKKQDNKLEWNNLSITYPNSPFNAKVEVTLSGMGNLSSPDFDSIESYLLAVYPKDKEIKGVNLLQPLSLKFNLEYIKNRLTVCGHDLKTVKIYTNGKNNNSGKADVEELKTTIDPSTNSITAELTELKGYQQYGIFTDIVVGAKPSKFLWGCGDDSKAWIEGDYLINKEDNFKIELPKKFSHPLVSEGLVNNRIQFSSLAKNEPEIMIVSQYNWQTLKLEELDNLRYPGYEMSPDSDFYASEVNKNVQTLNFSNRDFLEVKSSKNGNEVYRLLTVYKKSNEDYVFVIEIEFNQNSSVLYDKYVNAAKNIARSFSQLQ